MLEVKLGVSHFSSETQAPVFAHSFPIDLEKK